MAKRYPLALWRVRKELTMTRHAQLTVNEIRGPYMQLLTNLQGKDGRIWLQALNVFLRKGHPWLNKPDKYDAYTYINESIEKIRGVTLMPETHVAFAWKVVTNARDDQKKIIFFIEFLGKDSSGTLFEFDRFIDLTDFVTLIDEKDWSSVEKLIKGGYPPTDAFLEVAVENIFKSACLDIEINNDETVVTWYLQLPTKGRHELTAETDTEAIQKCLRLNFSKLREKPLF